MFIFIFLIFFLDDTIFISLSHSIFLFYFFQILFWRHHFLYPQSNLATSFFIYPITLYLKIFIFYNFLFMSWRHHFLYWKEKTYFQFFQYFLWADNSIFIFHFLKSFNSNFFFKFISSLFFKNLVFFLKNLGRGLPIYKWKLQLKNFIFIFLNFLYWKLFM